MRDRRRVSIRTTPERRTPPAPQAGEPPAPPAGAPAPRVRIRRPGRRRRSTDWPLAAALLAATAALTAVVVARGPLPPVRVDDLPDATAYSAEPLGEPTPVFAMYRSLRIELPVPPDALNALAFHQASNDKALPMRSLLADADMGAVIRTGRSTVHSFTVQGATDGEAAAAEAGAPGILQGAALRLWRSSRTGPPDRCADVGAPAGTTVLAPVTGKVLLVRPYELYDKYPDFEIHIQPDGWPEVDCVLIHVDGVAVEAGDTVVGGITPIAKVRRLSDRLPHQLGQYVAGGGDHVHVQLNKLAVPGRIEIDGEQVEILLPEPAEDLTPR